MQAIIKNTRYTEAQNTLAELSAAFNAATAEEARLLAALAAPADTFNPLEAGLRLLHLCLEMVDACGSSGHLGLGNLHIFLPGRLFGLQLLLSLQLLAGQFQLCLLLCNLSAQARQRCSARIHGGALHAGVDLHQQCPFLDPGSWTDQQTGDLTRDLRPYIHIGSGLQGADGSDGGLHIAALNRNTLVLDPGPTPPPQGNTSSTDQQQPEATPAFDLSHRHERCTFQKTIRNRC